MVTLYGLDTLNILRSSSESVNLSSVSSFQASNAKKWQRHQLQELLGKNENTEDLNQSSKIQAWFKSLSVSARYSVVSHEAPLICTFIWQMFIKKLSEGEVNFSFQVQNPKYFEIEHFETNFKIKKKTAREQSISNVDFQVEKAFEKSIRLSDSNEYLDTLTLEIELLSDIDKFFDYLKLLSNGKVFKVPCQVTWDPSLKVWVWDYPPWFTPTSPSPLAIWACASIEKAIWSSYWCSNNLDPINPKSTSKTFHQKEISTQSCQLLENLTTYFKDLKAKDKEKIVGNTETISTDFIYIKNQLNKYSTKCVSYFTMPKSATFYPSSHLCFPFYPHPLTCLYSYTEQANIKFNQSPESINTIVTRLANGNDAKFLDFLMNTPLERAVTLLDIVIRKVLYRINNAYTEKNALELMQTESVAVKDAKPGEKCKKKKNKRKNSKKNIKSQKKVVTAEEKEKIQTFISEFLKKLIESTFKAIETKEELKQDSKSEGFQEVFSQKSKYRKQPQPTQTPKKKPTKHSRKLPKLLQRLTQPSQTPPLTIYDKLHKEILDFGKSRTWKLESKIAQINKVLQKLAEIVSVTFQSASIELFGSYASGLAIEESDVDLVVTRLEFTERIQLEMACEYLGKVIEDSNLASKIQIIPTARIPVIKLEINTKTVSLAEGLINIDITFDDSIQGQLGSHLGLSTLYLTIELQKIYPPLQYLVLVIKKFLYKQDLNSAYKGGLSSYSLVLWVAALLNSMPTVPDNLGKLFCEFLKYFGCEFEPGKVGVNILNGGSFFELENKGCEAVVTIDPVNLLNITRMAYRIGEVLAGFKWAYETLHLNEVGKNKNILHRIFTRNK